MESFVHSFIKAFGWSILHSFWQGAIIFAVLFGILYLVPKSSSKQRHNLSFLSICLMLVWFIATFTSKWEVPTQEVLSGLSASGPDTIQVISETSGFMANAEAIFPVIISTYLLGLLLQVFLIIRGYLYLRKLRRTQLVSVSPYWQHTMLKLCGQLDVRKNVNFKISSLVHSPLVVGYLKPIILFPVGFHTYLSPEQVEAILIHELTHIRRNDYLFNLIKTIIETILFFNPFVWLAGRFIQIERENACDDKVLAHIQRPMMYANALLTLETSGKNSNTEFALGATGKPQHLFHRIKRITNMKSNYLNVRQQIAALFVAIAGLASIAWMQPVKLTIQENPEPLIELPKEIQPTPNLNLINISPAPILPRDTVVPPAKTKQNLKIIVTDNNGVSKEYSSVSELPDSIKLKLDKSSKALKIMGDSLKLRLSKFKDLESLNLFFKDQNNELSKIQNFEKEFKVFDSLKAAKLYGNIYKIDSDKIQKELKSAFKKFDDPKFKAQIEGSLKFVDSMQFKGQFDNIAKKFNSFQFNAISDDMNGKLKEIYFGNDGIRLLKDSLIVNGNPIYFDSKSLFQSKEEAALKKSKEYQRLKEKFDKDVEKLRKKEKLKKKS